jgi:hypothetical protein
LPIPKPAYGSAAFAGIAASARRLADEPGDSETMAQLQGAAARLYELDAAGFAHVLSTFPLVDAGIRDASMAAFIRTI